MVTHLLYGIIKQLYALRYGISIGLSGGNDRSLLRYARAEVVEPVELRCRGPAVPVKFGRSLLDILGCSLLLAADIL